jgi:hypothetical protein
MHSSLVFQVVVYVFFVVMDIYFGFSFEDENEIIFSHFSYNKKLNKCKEKGNCIFFVRKIQEQTAGNVMRCFMSLNEFLLH